MDSISNISMLEIEVFLRVADCRSITEASRKLFISQSAATRWIQKLESSMNIVLFTRTNKGIELTDDGKLLYKQLKPLYSKLKAVFFNSRTADGMGKVIRLACMDANEIVDELSVIIKQYENLYPGGAEIDVTVCSYQNLREGILSGKYDCAISYSVSSKGLPGTEFRAYRHMDTYFAVSAVSPAIRGDRLDYSSLSNSYIYIKPTTYYDLNGDRGLSICRSHGFIPRGIQYVSEEHAVETLVRDTNGFSIAGPGFGMKYGNDIRLFKVEQPIEEEQYIGLLWRPADASGDIRRFIESVPYMDMAESTLRPKE